MLHAREGAKCLRNRGFGDPHCARRGRRGDSVFAIVLAGDERLGRQRIIGTELDSLRPAGECAEVVRHDRDVRFRLVFKDAQLRSAIGVV